MVYLYKQTKGGYVTMKHVTLVPLDLQYADIIFQLSSNEHVKNALGLQVDKVEDTKQFILFTQKEELQKQSISRAILNKKNEVIGVTTLKHIHFAKKRCHIGSWLGYPYWGQGYNEAAKKEILTLAFQELDLDYVFAGAKTINTRSQKAQEKLPYISLHVENEFPEELTALEEETGVSCVLHAFYKHNFLQWLSHFHKKGGVK